MRLPLAPASESARLCRDQAEAGRARRGHQLCPWALASLLAGAGEGRVLSQTSSMSFCGPGSYQDVSSLAWSGLQEDALWSGCGWGTALGEKALPEAEGLCFETLHLNDISEHTDTHTCI